MMLSKKGQKSLEMIVGMLILLVVAGVVIKLFMDTFAKNPIGGFIDPVKQRTENIQRECKSYCSAYKSGMDDTAGFSYCTKNFRGDMTGDKQDDGAFQIAPLLRACEDNFYCFHVYKCELDNGEVLDAGRCKQILCNGFKEQYRSIPGTTEEQAVGYATNQLFQYIKPGSCNLTMPGQINWYQAIFASGCS